MDWTDLLESHNHKLELIFQLTVIKFPVVNLLLFTSDDVRPSIETELKLGGAEVWWKTHKIVRTQVANIQRLPILAEESEGDSSP